MPILRSSKSLLTRSSNACAAGAVRQIVHVTKTSSYSAVQSDDASHKLVDNLIEYTQSLMKSTTTGSNHRHLVAFSGGVDSSLVLALLKEASTGGQQHVAPVLGISPAVPQEQIDLARKISHHLGFELTEVRTEEGTDDVYIANEGQACLACKTHLYTSLEAVLDHTAATTVTKTTLYNGTNADDTLDPTRLGLIAAQRYSVLSPLQLTPKADVRRAAQHLGLPNWNYAASPCLRSRLALGVEATQHHLEMIEQAEILVKQTLSGYNETWNLRVRMLSKQRARVEVDAERVPEAEFLVESVWTPHFQRLGFRGVSVKAFKSGAVSVKLAEDISLDETPSHEQQQQQRVAV